MAATEPEGEFVKVVVEMTILAPGLMGAGQTSLEKRGYEVNARRDIVSRFGSGVQPPSIRHNTATHPSVPGRLIAIEPQRTVIAKRAEAAILAGGVRVLSKIIPSVSEVLPAAARSPTTAGRGILRRRAGCSAR